MPIDLLDILSLSPPFSGGSEGGGGGGSEGGLTQFGVGGCCCPPGPCCGTVTLRLTDEATGDPLPGMDVRIGVAVGSPGAATVGAVTDVGDGTYTARYCGNADGYGGPAITLRWSADDPTLFSEDGCSFNPNGYLNNCGDASVDCGDDLTIDAVLWPLAPDWIPACNTFTPEVGCYGAAASCPDVPPPEDGYTGRAMRRVLWVTLHNAPATDFPGFPELECCEESIYGDFDGVPIMLTWDGDADVCTPVGGSSPISPLRGPRYVSDTLGGYYGGRWATFACRFNGSDFLCSACDMRYNAGEVEYFPCSGLVRVTQSDPDPCPEGCHAITPPFDVSFQLPASPPGNLCHPTDVAFECVAAFPTCYCGTFSGEVTE